MRAARVQWGWSAEDRVGVLHARTADMHLLPVFNINAARSIHSYAVPV